MQWPYRCGLFTVGTTRAKYPLHMTSHIRLASKRSRRGPSVASGGPDQPIAQGLIPTRPSRSSLPPCWVNSSGNSAWTKGGHRGQLFIELRLRGAVCSLLYVCDGHLTNCHSQISEAGMDNAGSPYIANEQFAKQVGCMGLDQPVCRLSECA